MKIIVTGGRGFIGSHFVEEVLQRGWEVYDIDKMTYAANEKLPWDDHPNYKWVKKDITTLKSIPNCDYIFNFAAESHVDNSIRDTEPFIHSNILGVHNLLQLVRGKPEYERPTFVQISTDEVYGDKVRGASKERDSLNPSNPYSATKASAEMLLLSYARTYGIEYLITRSSNNYGARQYKEKLIPKCIDSIKRGKKIPVHGNGTYVRDWTYVKDNIKGILKIIDGGYTNDIFNIASQNHLTNLEVISKILSWYNKERDSSITYVENRWGQDTRYSVNTQKISNIGWEPLHPSGIVDFR